MSIRCFLAMSVLLAGVTTFALPVRVVPDPERDLACVIASRIDLGGLDLWGERILTVGQPNACDRRDRAVIRFDLRPFLEAGKVTEARLKLDYAPLGFSDTRRLELSRFTTELGELNLYCGFLYVTEAPREWLVDGAAGAGTLELDMTGEVNAALEKGCGSIAFRIRDCRADAEGNPGSVVRVVRLPVNGIRLEVAAEEK